MNNQTEVKGHDDIYGKGKSAEAVGALDASAKYLSCMGIFFGALESWRLQEWWHKVLDILEEPFFQVLRRWSQEQLSALDL